ncbi:MAG: tetratricopeptide repeat protein [Gammaproteobacteria bacterium]|nr:tetratricopeptide repeat protein [Gammaproteobacteria bacterium]MCW5582786.1 tetratricopeptide repeat protein [Gammaproteobacteria bacterium]
MTEYLTEQEQIEILKSWIKQYSLVILAGVVIAIAGISGWHYWQQRQNNILDHASAVYDEMITMRAQNDDHATLVQAKKLFSRYPQTTYGQMAAFMLARDAVTKKNFAKAEEKLTWVIEHSKIDSMRQIARIRLARIMIATNKPQNAIDHLKIIEDKNFSGLINEVKGDAYLAMKNITMARQAYQQALSELPNAEVVRPILQMKYDNLATTTLSAS